MSGHDDIDPFAAPLEEIAPGEQIEASPNLKNPPARIEKSPKYPEFVRALRALKWQQRKFVKLLPAANYVPIVALEMMPQGSRASVYRWMHSKPVKAAIALQIECACEAAGVDPVRVVLQIADVARYCAEEIDLFSRDGKPLGRGRRSVPDQLRALELLAKHTGVIKPADNRTTNITNNAPAQFVYQIISSKDGAPPEQISGTGAVIDAECTEVKEP